MTFAQNTSRRSGQKRFKPKSIVVQIRPEDLRISSREVARYAGGSRYKMDRKTEALAETIIKRAGRLIRPVFAYAVHPIKVFDSEKGACLDNGIFIKLPQEEQDPGMVYLAASVCTLGPNLETKVNELMSQGNALEGLLLDSAGVAFLELVAQKTYKQINKEAGKAGLYTGCRFGPGYRKMPLYTQEYLFKLIDATAIDVQLNENGVMFPMKSLSFWVRWTRKRRPTDRNRYKCQACDLKDCAFRVAS